ncbi:PREDICTED: glycosyltransferase family 92 protein RCOM_0530710 [Ipomoea nil]|uniref:glycosyltransferase family 92 protein RCOM_0530710 n=1 Tax=Ipomoea nil TaxID=35883 RepID=UPI0009015AF6|nr:PREDICTED: glycosyltransferase family 92 protein RCOM_0530710 [Ipomoea nil]
MKDCKKGSSLSSSIPVKPCNFFICSTLLLIFLFFSGFAFSTSRLFFLGFCPRLVTTWSASAMGVIPGDTPENSVVSIPEAVISPDEALFFLKYPSSTRLFTKDELDCVYTSPDSYSSPAPPKSVDDEYSGRQIVRCQPPPRGSSQVSLAVKKTRRDNQLPALSLAGPTYRWDSLAYEAMIDWDNTTVVFVKGFNLRGGKVSDPTKFRCVYGWDFKNPKFMLHSYVVSVAQEIVRCKTPLSVLNSPHRFGIKVSVRKVGKGPLDSIARPQVRLKPSPKDRKEHQMCVCTMLKNQARFLREWIMYHAEIGVQRWFIYDNNSDDNIEDILGEHTATAHNYNISRHVWPWIKSQEAGFAHCALRARDLCEWVGFIDVDEFFYLSKNTSIQEVLRRQGSGIAELRVPCHSFGPSGLKEVPIKGVTVGYTCRLAYPERHKSIVRPEALDPTLMNVVHHFRLSQGYKSGNIDRNVMVVNHYKYQVWQVFKEKFHRRVATYVSDWQQDRNAGSKDRAPGLGTRAVEPADWHTRFCEVTDNGLRDQVLRTFTDPINRRLPWQEDEQQD